MTPGMSTSRSHPTDAALRPKTLRGVTLPRYTGVSIASALRPPAGMGV